MVCLSLTTTFSLFKIFIKMYQFVGENENEYIYYRFSNIFSKQFNGGKSYYLGKKSVP